MTRDRRVGEVTTLRRRVAELERDLADRKPIEEVLKESEDRFRVIFENLRDGLLVADKESRKFLIGNPAIHEMLGYDGTELRQLGTVDIHPEQDLPRLIDCFERLAGKELDVARDIPVKRKDGSVFLADITASFPVVFEGRECVVGVFRDVTERHEMRGALASREERYSSIFRNAPVGIFVSNLKGKFVAVNTKAARMMGYESPEEMISTVNQTSISETLYTSPERRQEIVEKVLESQGDWVEFETGSRCKDGEIILVRFLVRRVSPELDLLEGFAEDITEQKQAEALLWRQRDLALTLASTGSLHSALEHVLRATMQIQGIDSGGIYLVDSSTGHLQLAYHAGLSPDFIDVVSSYGPESPQAHFVMQGEPVYWSYLRGFPEVGELLIREGITALAIIPVKSDGEVIAVLSLASHSQPEISEGSRSALETIAAHIGGVVSRLSMGEQLKTERKNLEETNAALKVLLRQRDEDRKELEEAFLVNVKNVVLPYAEKLRNSRLTPDQVVFLEIIESHLKEITSPFLRTLARQFAELTPTEIKVANLIRDGRTTKEIAAVLLTAENTVHSHRNNLRRKLGMPGKKMNLRSYLSSLT